MESGESRICQCHCVPQLSVGTIHVRPHSLGSWLKLTLKRSLGDNTKRTLKKRSSQFIKRIGLNRNRGASAVSESETSTNRLAAGDMVRVRSENEIRTTLNAWNELKGCMFMDAQRQFCGTIQRVLKPVERFVDERDYRVKKARGLVLLDGLMCEGTPDYGRCDRACFYFWREEWLEKIS